MKEVNLYRPISIGHALEDFNRYVESFFGDSLAPATRIMNHLPAVDVRETDSTYLLEAELPGYDEKTVEVQVNGGTLTLKSKKGDASCDVSPKAPSKEEEEHKKGTFLVQERRNITFSRSFKLPDNADTEKVSACFKNGILTMEIKKRAGEQKRIIPIQS
ncbi:MAG: Hsp20/alpha crystallin family protein [Treponema sp.]|jgi:HSP20 family protein|nr:Hsp20/alpha crystallin family protein [Treponema sp.]